MTGLRASFHHDQGIITKRGEKQERMMRVAFGGVMIATASTATEKTQN